MYHLGKTHKSVTSMYNCLWVMQVRLVIGNKKVRTNGSTRPKRVTVLYLLQICRLEENTRGKTYWDNEGMVPYFVDGTLWVGFDNVRSISMKVGRYFSSENCFIINWFWVLRYMSLTLYIFWNSFFTNINMKHLHLQRWFSGPIKNTLKIGRSFLAWVWRNSSLCFHLDIFFWLFITKMPRSPHFKRIM